MDNAAMISGPPDPRWPRLLALAVHEFRTPLTVTAGYIRMVLKDRGGPLNEPQRRLLEEAEKSCGRLSELVGEMSDLSALEGGTATFNRTDVDLRSLLAEVIAVLQEVPDRTITTELMMGSGPAPIKGDPVRLRSAFTSLINALRRELVTSSRLCVRENSRVCNGTPSSWIAIAGEGQVAELEATQPEALAVFDEWRGGCGLGLAIARRVIVAHGGTLWSPPDRGKAAAVVILPHA